MLSVDQALEAVVSSVQPHEPKSVALQDAFRGVLARNLTIPHPSPPFDKSMMDGFAVCSDPNQPAELKVGETITAGTVPSTTVESGTASRIMTGAPMPSGADCVVPIEKVRFNESQPDVVGIASEDLIPEKNVLRQGSLAQTGDELLSAGTQLRPQHIAVLAEFGVAEVPIATAPRIAVLATGDELLPFDQPLSPGHIRNSNEPMLVSQIQQSDAIPVPLGVARDNVEELRRCIQAGLNCDFMILSGGVSAGTLDLVPSELAAAGVVEVFHKISMKPGKPLWFGKLNTSSHTCYVFGLPGNPVSSMVCFDLFVKTAIRRFRGEASVMPSFKSVRLSAPVSVRGGREVFMPCRFSWSDAGVTAEAVRWGGSADLRSTATAQGLCRLQPGRDEYAAGECVPAIIWD